MVKSAAVHCHLQRMSRPTMAVAQTTCPYDLLAAAGSEQHAHSSSPKSIAEQDHDLKASPCRSQVQESSQCKQTNGAKDPISVGLPAEFPLQGFEFLSLESRNSYVIFPGLESLHESLVQGYQFLALERTNPYVIFPGLDSLPEVFPNCKVPLTPPRSPLVRLPTPPPSQMHIAGHNCHPPTGMISYTPESPNFPLEPSEPIDEEFLNQAVEFSRHPIPREADIKPLCRPFAVPQVHDGIGVPFSRVYSPSLLTCHGISMSDFVEFIDNLNIVATASPVLQVVDIVGNLMTNIPYHWAIITGLTMSASARLATLALSIGRTEMYMRKVNDDFFGPRKLKASLCSHRAMTAMLGIPPDEPVVLPLTGEFESMTSQERRLAAVQPWMMPITFDVPPPTEHTKLLARFCARQVLNQSKKYEKKLIGHRRTLLRRGGVSGTVNLERAKELRKLAKRVGKIDNNAERKLEKVEKPIDVKRETEIEPEALIQLTRAEKKREEKLRRRVARKVANIEKERAKKLGKVQREIQKKEEQFKRKLSEDKESTSKRIQRMEEELQMVELQSQEALNNLEEGSSPKPIERTRSNELRRLQKEREKLGDEQFQKKHYRDKEAKVARKVLWIVIQNLETPD